ncbi:transmembrane protein 70 homolog, mitochondrial [Condylostylus longicornis]|uniref:transmembrane protein 70 homolog, mitochondrial n=1 Tax=Condylostylus longicornis TaxID=2530218 RepID=UPI00244DBF6C|nr:transmembrane protein 70 homolog, mitochondrial [Condylostylus longicornis]
MNVLRVAYLAAKPKICSLNNQNFHKNILINSYLGFNKFSSQTTKNETRQIKVYYGSLTPRMKAVKVFSLTTSLTGLLAQPVLLEQGTKIGGTGMAIFLCGFAGFFTFVTPFLLHIITRNYVTELFYDLNRDEYTANTISLFLQKLETKFKVDDVKVPEVPGMFTSIQVGKTSLFLDPSQFTEPDHYVRIMGYDKPIDFKLEFKELDQLNKKERIEENK